jgi:hypothetical protein
MKWITIFYLPEEMELACFICSLATSMPGTSIQAPMNCYLYMCTSICCVPTCILSTTMFILQVFPGIYTKWWHESSKVSKERMRSIGVVPRLGPKTGDQMKKWGWKQYRGKKKNNGPTSFSHLNWSSRKYHHPWFWICLFDFYFSLNQILVRILLIF